jgi:hypothetical protein
MNIKPICPRGHDKNIVGRTKGKLCRQCHIDRLKAWRADHSINTVINSRNQGFRKAGILNTDGSPFTCLDYDRAYQIRQGRCAGCGIHQTEQCRRLDADHDHITGVFRFLLCMNCNRILGHAKDNPAILRHMADLLESI